MIDDVTIVGAGPYGLSLAAHLQARRIPFRILGTPMEFWQNSMPEGMSLKSEGRASSIYDPEGSFTLSKYCAEEDIPYADIGLPVTLASFISYGLEFQRRFAPSVERRNVTSVTRNDQGFTLSLDDGERFSTRKLVLAIGVGYFAHVPSELAIGAHGLVTHSSRHADVSAFANKDVAVVGSGASALDLAALLVRAHARPVIVARAPSIEFHEQPRLPRSMRSRLWAPSSGLGVGWPAWLYCNAPLPFHYFPDKVRLHVTKTRLGPVGCWFTKDAVVGKVPIFCNSKVEKTTLDGDRVCLRLSQDGANFSSLDVDHVIAATGYRVDVDRIAFLGESLRALISRLENSPNLSSNFEASVAGLYFVGPAAANSFGPLQRFAVGARFAARRVSRSLEASVSK